MEPLVPAEGAQALDDEVVALIAESNQLAGRIHPILRDSIGDRLTGVILNHGSCAP